MVACRVSPTRRNWVAVVSPGPQLRSTKRVLETSWSSTRSPRGAAVGLPPPFEKKKVKEKNAPRSHTNCVAVTEPFVVFDTLFPFRADERCEALVFLLTVRPGRLDACLHACHLGQSAPVKELGSQPHISIVRRTKERRYAERKKKYKRLSRNM